MNNNLVVAGSLSALARNAGHSLAESFVSCDVIIIVDTSGSMNTRDSRGGASRYDVAIEELRNLQNQLPGKIAVIAFSDKPQFCPSGIATYLGSGTALHTALEFTKVADVEGMQFILVSDGEPDQPGLALAVARTYKNKIDVIYVGPEDRPSGRAFLQKLASITGGATVTVDRAMELQSGILRLLEASSHGAR